MNSLSFSETKKISLASFTLRLILGCVIFAHGAQKMFGWFGGHGYWWTVDAWNKWFGFPSIFIQMIIWFEFLAPILLIVGLFTRFAAGVIGFIMVGAILLVHGRWGFFMNWYGQPKTGEGFEYHILALGMVVGLLILGGGKWTISNYILNRNRNQG